VFNGEKYLSQALDALLAQTYTDFELIISDNASTDSTEDICRAYADKDERIRYLRQPVNVGAAPNHNLLVPLARGRYFKWAAHDDLYDPELFRLCVEALEQHPDVVLAHSWDAIIDADGRVLREVPYELDTADPRPAVRLGSLLRVPGGNDFYGVMRTDVLRGVRPHGTYYNADRTFVAELVLHGPFYQVPQTLYFRRDHVGRASRAGGHRARAAALAPHRANRWRNPMPLMYVEYVAGFLSAVWRAPLSGPARACCWLETGRWLASRLLPGHEATRLEDAWEVRA
jgi:glycosyltransferase involved in cell wall biosynthesis